MPLPVLDATDQRILGSLLEKQRTVPASYPLTLNALKAACNQATSRDPLTSLDDATLEAGVRELKRRGLVRVVWAGKGARTLKYHQLLDDELSLQPDERALLTVLLLRGPQSAGELRTRTERLHPFEDRSDVEVVLRRMAALSDPLVRELERRPGQQDRRWVHLLGPVPTGTGAESVPPADREVVIADGPSARDDRVRAAYDAVADAWSDATRDDLTRQPFDVWLLERLAAEAGARPVVDVGCGPGHVSAFLADAGVRLTAIDSSPGMVAATRRAYPDLDVAEGRLDTLLRPRTAAGWGAVLAWFSLVHLAPSEIGPAVAGLARTLAAGGVLGLALYAGDDVRRLAEVDGEPVDLAFVLHDPDAVLAAVRAAGLVEVEWYQRGPLPGEPDATRLYVVARAAGG